MKERDRGARAAISFSVIVILYSFLVESTLEYVRTYYDFLGLITHQSKFIGLAQVVEYDHLTGFLDSGVDCCTDTVWRNHQH